MLVPHGKKGNLFASNHTTEWKSEQTLSTVLNLDYID